MTLVENHNKTVFTKEFLFQVVLCHIVGLGLGAMLFSWTALLFAFLVAMLFAYPMGIFHHMLLSHRSFKCKLWVEHFGALLGTLTWRGPMASPIRYAAMHRIHHAHSDTELDPHTPTKGLFFAYMSWFWQLPLGFSDSKHYYQYVPDLVKDEFLVFLDENVDGLQLFWGTLCFVAGGAFPMLSGAAFDPVNGLRFLVFGVFVKTLFVLYLVNAVDVVNHTVGYRGYETKDQSTNSFLMAIIHLGGAISWHNNHHAHQHYFSVKKRWWEFDAHLWMLQAMSQFGWVWDIQVLDETRRASGRNLAKPVVSGG